MNEILSQEEIEQLLSSVEVKPSSSLEAAAKHIKVYDFKRPDKFSKEQIRTIQMIHETYARLTTTSLSAQLRSFVHIHVVSVEQLSYDEFSRSVPNPSTLAIVNMDPLKGSAIVEIDPSITFTIIDRLFGGSGDILKENRELTDIELSVIETIIIRILGNLREAWSSVIDLKPKFSNIETNIQFAQIVPPNDMVVLVVFEIKIGNINGIMNFCVPYITIESIVNRLSAQFWYSASNTQIDEDEMSLLKHHILKLPLDLRAVLGETTLRIQDVLELEPNDVVLLDKKVSDNLDIYLGDKVKYKCVVGLIGKKMGTKITKVLRD